MALSKFLKKILMVSNKNAAVDCYLCTQIHKKLKSLTNNRYNYEILKACDIIASGSHAAFLNNGMLIMDKHR